MADAMAVAKDGWSVEQEGVVVVRGRRSGRRAKGRRSMRRIHEALQSVTVSAGVLEVLVAENRRLHLRLAHLELELERLREENGMLPEVLLECERQLAGLEATRPC